MSGLVGFDMPVRYLVLCTGNRCRSQMAHGFLQSALPDAEVFSAGTHPKGVHPTAVEVMKEKGIDLSGYTSDHVDAYAGQDFDVVITVCDAAKDACPVFPGARRTIHHSFDDPDGHDLDTFRRVRDEIGAWANHFATQQDG